MDPDKQLPSGDLSINEQFLDAAIRHQIGLMRLSGSIRNEVFEILEATEKDLRDQIERRLRRGLPGGSFSATRMRLLEKALRTIRTTAWEKVEEVWVREMTALARAEPEFTQKALATVSPVTLDLALPAAATLETLVRESPFEGRTLREWASTIAEADVRRIRDQVRIGLVQGEGAIEIARRVVGIVRLRGSDGVTQITRNNAAAITRTMVNHYSNQSRRLFFEENKDVFEEELYVATLDARTTPVCRANDGKRFEVGVGPIPPLHFNCRSLRVAVIDGEVLGRRPARRFTQRMLLREYSRQNGLPTVTSRGALPRGHRLAFDSFARGRIRELTGTVPAKLDYGTFLRRQSREFQDDVLGVTKARLFRRGKLALDRFINRQGDELTLAQLARREGEAFRAAGLDPDDFK